MPDSGGDASRTIPLVLTFERKGARSRNMWQTKVLIIRHVVRGFDVAVEM